MDAFILVFNIILPIAAVVSLGYICRIGKVFPESFGPILLKFAVHIALPALLFIRMAMVPAKAIENQLTYDFVGTFTFGMLLTFFAALIFYWRWSKDNIASSAIAALNASMSNAAMLALPLLVALFGQTVMPLCILCIAVVVLIIFPLAELIVVMSLSSQNSLSWLLKHTGLIIWQLFKTPFVLATILGLLFSLFAWPIPSPIKHFANSLALTFIPCGLFAIGASLDIANIRGLLKYIIPMSIIKLIIQPGIMLILIFTTHMPAPYSIVALIAAAVPPTKASVSLASKYQLLAKEAAAGTVMMTVLSLISVTVWLLIANALWPHYFMAHTRIDKMMIP